MKASVPVTARTAIHLPAFRREGDAPKCATLREDRENERTSNKDARNRFVAGAQGAETAFRAAPLFRISTGHDRSIIIIGEWRFFLTCDRVLVEADIHATWIASVDGCDWRRQDPLTIQVPVLVPDPFIEPHGVPDDDLQSWATVLAKATAEESRNTVEQLRRVRYEIEGRLARTLRKEVDAKSILTVLSDVIELSTAAGLARDRARSCIRSGFWLHLDEEVLYHQYRRALDPTILKPVAPADADTRVWMSKHDAGMRQCRSMEEQLTEEMSLLSGLLNATATVSAARDAEASDRFNSIASAAALGLGLPSLVLAYYGADKLLPLNSGAKALALFPILIAAVVAAVLAKDHLPVPRRGPARVCNSTGWAVVVAFVSVAFLTFAGWLANFVVK